MSSVPPIRTRLKQARLGEVQRHVLAVLAVQKAEADLNGITAGGLTYRDVMAEIHQYVVIGERQWLPSVVARLEIEDGRHVSAAMLLLDHIATALFIALPIAKEAVFSAQSPGNNNWLAVEGAYFAQRAHTRLNQLLIRFSDTRQHFQNLSPTDQEGVVEAYLLNVWDLAKELALVTTHSSETAQLIHAVILPDEWKEKATSRLAVQQASLSRSLRILEVNLLIERREVEVVLDDGSHAHREARFFITEAGLARLRPD